MFRVRMIKQITTATTRTLRLVLLHKLGHQCPKHLCLSPPLAAIRLRIEYKIILTTLKTLNGSRPQYGQYLKYLISKTNFHDQSVGAWGWAI